MGKKGKNKNVAAASTAPKVVSDKKAEEPEKNEEIKVEPPMSDPIKVEQPKIETKVEPPKIEAVVLKENLNPPEKEIHDNNDNENESETLKSKKKRNRKKKNTLATSDETPKNEVIGENISIDASKSEPTPVENESQNNSETLKKKRNRNRKKNNSTVGATTEQKDEEKSDETPEKFESNDTNEQSATSTLKKRKRNRNKNKNAANDAVNEALAAAQKIELPVETPSAPTETQSRKGKKQKRFDLSSKKTILDEIQEKQEREQKEARENIQKEIAKREKLLETIDMVLDCHKSEAELAKNQQESLKDLSKLAQAPKTKSKPSNKSPPKSPNEEQLVNKIEQVLGVTKLEIKNVQNQQAYVDRLETELAKVKQNKDRLLRGENLEASTSSVIPPQIQQMTSQICDLTKETPKTKEELIREIQNRDKLMSEINRVLDTTKDEIEKVQKQQKIISNLEVELTKIKDQEIAEKLMALEKEDIEEEPPKEEKLSTASASLLDALMANVGKLKEAQALKEKQKLENEPKKKASSPPKNSEQIKKVEEKYVEGKPDVETKKQEEKPKLDNEKPSSPKDNKEGNKSENKPKGDEPKKIDEKSEVIEQKPVIQKEQINFTNLPVIANETTQTKTEIKPIETTVPKEEPKLVETQSKIEPVTIPVKETQSKPIEVQPIISNEPIKKQESSNKKNNKKDSPKGNAKNKNNQPKMEPPIVENKSIVDPVFESAWQKPSMAEMLKNAPDPPPEEVNKKEEKKIEEEHAPLARPESAIIEVPIIPASTSQPEKIEDIEKAPEQPVEVIAEPKVDEKETSPIDENMVIVSQQEVEQMIIELEKNELTGSKNDEAGGFACPVNDQKESVKPPLSTPPPKNDGKSSKPSAKTPPKPSGSKPTPKPQNAAKPKVDTNKPKPHTDAKKQPPVKPQKSTESAPKTVLQETSEPSNKPVENATLKNENVSETVPKISPPTSKSPSKPDPLVSKSSASKPVSSASTQRAQPKAGNVTKTSSTSSTSRPTKSNTPSPSKSPSSGIKPTSTPSNITSSTTTPKPKTTPLATTRTAPPKQPSTKPSTQSQTTKSQPAKSNASKPSTNTASKQQQSTSDSVSRHRQMEPLNNVSNISQPPAFSLRKTDEKSTPIIPQTPNQMKAILTADGSIKIFLPPTSLPSIVCSDMHRSKDVSRSILKDSSLLKRNVSVTSSASTQKFPKSINLMRNLFDESDDDDDETLAQYKMTPKNIFMATICHVCKVNLSRYYLCKECKMISYCKEEHMKIDYLNHKALCMAIQLISKRRGGHIYNMAKHLSNMEFRNLRIHSILLCEEFLNRSLCAFERELFLFPRLCHEQKCREWRDQLLSDCEKCGQVSYCTLHPLSTQHNLICSSFALLQRIVLHEKSYGRIHVELPQKVLKRVPVLTENVFDTLRLLYRSIHAFQDDCVNAALMQIATTPLTAFYGYLKAGLEFNNEQMVIHLVGAEMQFEGDSLEKWESFFLHIAHGVSDLLIIFIGPELNTENLPLEIISRTRMCKSCRLNCCGVRFDFQCKKFYHDYCSSSSYIKPDLICFFNPGLHRPGFRGFETWTKTIKSAISSTAPIIVTSTTENENFLDLQKIQKVCENSINVLVPPQKNPYANTRPERNFVSDDDVSIMFKNNFMFVVSDRNLIDL